MLATGLSSDECMVRVLKVLYFPHVSIWEAKYKWNNSWMLQSLLARHDVIREEVSINIGNVRSTHIWSAWLPYKLASFRLQ